MLDLTSLIGLPHIGHFIQQIVPATYLNPVSNLIFNCVIFD
jgi:hypothetical protein